MNKIKKNLLSIIKFIKKYLPDIIILIGVTVISYNFLRPAEKRGLVRPSLNYTDYHTEYKVFGILLLVIGINIAIRRYLISRKPNNQDK